MSLFARVWRRRSVAELARIVLTPAHHRSVVEQGKTESHPVRDLPDLIQTRNGLRSIGAGPSIAGLGPGVGTVTELAAGIGSPGIDRPVREQCEAVVARRHLDGRRHPGNGGGRV